ncbi:MAG: HNH endonuclease [Alphaproteobacteria bacterium]|nr:HNH endonuclease [Alphaproteobacteria bacterium]
MIGTPQKPFDTYKWRWLSVQPSEGLLQVPVFLGVLRALNLFEGNAFSSPELKNALAVVQEETQSSVTLARDEARNLFRNSGQYWRGTGLLAPDEGRIHLTPFGQQVAKGQVTKGEFVAVMIQQTVLPNPWTYKQQEIAKWRAANLEIRPFKLILEIIEELGRQHGGASSAFLNNRELVKVVIPLAGIKATAAEIARHVFLYRNDRLDVSGWPNCAPMDNDKRLAQEFLLFLSNFGILRFEKTGLKDDWKFYLDELFDVDAVTAPIDHSIFGNTSSAVRAVEEIRHSPLPSIVERQRTASTVLVRSGQSKFRNKIFKAYSQKCCLTGDIISDVLEAAHIVPVKHGGADDPNNGFCLRVDIHRLYDSGNLRISPSGVIYYSDAMLASRNYAPLPKRIAIPSFVNPANLKWREDYY